VPSVAGGAVGVTPGAVRPWPGRAPSLIWTLDGRVKPTDIISPGCKRDTAAIKSCEELMGKLLTLQIVSPGIRPAIPAPPPG